MQFKKRNTSNIPKKEHDSSSHIVKDFLIPLGSLLIATIGLIAGKDKLPDWALYIVIFYIIAVILAILWKPTIRLYSVFRVKRRNRYLAKTFYPLLQDNSKEFALLIDDSKSNTIQYLLRDIKQWDELRIYELKNQPLQLNLEYIAEHMATIRSWHASIEKHLTFYRYKDFSQLASEFSKLIFQYHRFCTQIQKHLEPLSVAGMLSEQRLRHLKQEWNLRRENHMKFIKEWEDLTKKINETCGERLCYDYYEPLKTLE